MADLKMFVHFRETPPVEGLCPKCFNPALVRFTLQLVSLEGITTLGTRVACRDCRVWTSKLEDLEHDRA